MKERSLVDSDKLTDFQISVLVSSAIVGATIIYLPRILTKELGSAGFLVILAGGGFAALVALIATALSKRFPEETIVEYSSRIIGKFLSKVLGFAYLAYFIMIAAFVNRFFSDALKVFFLEKTPVEVISISMFLVVVYLVQHGINPIARIGEAFLPPTVLIFIIVIIVSAQNFQIERLYPAFQIGITPILKAVPKTLLSFLGFEILLFVCPYMKSPSKVTKYGLVGLAIPTVMYFFLATATIAGLGVDTTGYVLFPVLTLTRSVEFPGGFGERFDLFFLAFWILAAYTSIVTLFYLASLTVTRTLNLRNYKPFVYLLLPIIYLVSILPPNLAEVEKWLGYSGYLGAFLVVFVPFLLLLLAVIFKKGGKDSAKTKV
jgi:spore germination protein